MINIIRYSPDKGIEEIDPKNLKTWDYECTDNLWIDIYGATAAESQELLSSIFGFHQLAIEDSLKYLKDHKVHHPKIDDFDKYLFIVFNGISQEGKTFKYKIFSLSCFLGHNFLITIHNEPGENSIFNTTSTILSERSFRKGPDYILNLILDEIVDRYYPILDCFETETDSIEEELFKRVPNSTTLQKILNAKKELIRLRRISSYQKEVLFKLTRGDSDLISQEESVYYRNVYDHLVRVTDTTESYRDYAAGMLDSYLSIINNRMNEIMKFLTIIATIMLPLSLVAGIFGMNFEFPISQGQSGFYVSIVIMVIVAVGMILYFNKRKWI